MHILFRIRGIIDTFFIEFIQILDYSVPIYGYC